MGLSYSDINGFDFNALFVELIENIHLLPWYLILFVVPVLLVVFLVRVVFDRAMKVRRLNNLRISAYSWKTLCYDANRCNTSPRNRLENIFNNYYKVNNRFYR
jgi:hypothetical protein